ncbi:MAG TPA: WD40 repeat domain-containing protein, partial [Armatimonadota bacterium]|nr:WD40 repeat domain-containing protein [Armatimonadota bacterium]
MTARPLPTRRSLFLPLALALTMTAAALGAVKPGGGKKSLPAKPGAPRTPAAGKQKSPPPTGALSVNKGEIRLDGTIRTVDVAAMTLELEAVSYTLASGKTVRFPQPVSRAVLLAPGAALFVRDAPGRAVPVTELRAGLSAIAVGPKATPLAARQVAVWSREEAGKFVFDAGTPAPPPATSKNAPPPLTLSLDQVKPPPPPPADRPVLVPGTGHGSRVGFVRFLPGERILLTSGGDGTLKLWDVKSGRLKSTFRPGPDKLWAVDLSPDGSLAAYGGSDGKIGLWDPHAGHLLRTLSAMWGLTAGAFSPDGKRLALAGEQGVVEMWDTETGSRLKSWPNGPEKVRAAALAYSPDGTTLAVSGGDGQIRLWDPKTGHLRQTLTGQSAPRTLAYSPDGKLLASLSDAPAAWKNEGQEDSGRKDLGIEIRLWNPVSGELLRSWGVPGAGWFNGLGFSPDGKTLVVGGVEATMWDPRTGQPKGSLTGHPLTTAVAFSADGKTIVTGSAGSAILSELRPGAPGKLTFGDRDITGPLAFDPRGKLLAQGTEGGRINLWDPQRGRLVRRIDGEFPALGLLQFSPDGSRLLACSWANEAHVRDVATGRLLFRLENISRVHAAAFSPDGKTIASAGGVLR